jgi:hypothetical protein
MPPLHEWWGMLPTTDVGTDFFNCYTEIRDGKRNAVSFPVFRDGGLNLHEIGHLVESPDHFVLDPLYGMGLDSFGRDAFSGDITDNFRELEVVFIQCVLDGINHPDFGGDEHTARIVNTWSYIVEGAHWRDIGYTWEDLVKYAYDMGWVRKWTPQTIWEEFTRKVDIVRGGMP